MCVNVCGLVYIRVGCRWRQGHLNPDCPPIDVPVDARTGEQCPEQAALQDQEKGLPLEVPALAQPQRARGE